MVSAADRVTDERVTCLRIFADAAGETHMEDVDIAFQPRKLFKDNPPLRLSDNFPASWFNICHVPAGMCEVDWHNPPRRLLVLWLTGEVEFETSDGNVRRLPAGSVVPLRTLQARDIFPVIRRRANWWCTWLSHSSEDQATACEVLPLLQTATGARARDRDGRARGRGLAQDRSRARGDY